MDFEHISNLIRKEPKKYIGKMGFDGIFTIIDGIIDFLLKIGRNEINIGLNEDFSFDISYNGGDYCPFVSKLNTDGSMLVYSTFLGGSSRDSGWSIALDSDGCVYVAGSTHSADFPITTGAFNTSYDGSEYCAFVSKLNAEQGVRVKFYETYFRYGE